MKTYFTCILVSVLFIFQKSQAQTIDTLVSVGNHKIHFNITKGKGIPILFECGGGSVSTTWNSLLKPLHEITGTTLITYDRAGGGRSTIDTSETDPKKHSIINLMEDLEAGLKKLGYDKEIMLVAHLYGGYLATLYSVRHPNLVKSVVLIDVNHNYFDKYVEEDIKEGEKYLPEFKKNRLGLYYQLVNERETTTMFSSLSIPQHIPVIDFVHGITHLKDSTRDEYWKMCHKKFVESHPKSTAITAYECGHSIWYQNPSLVIHAIAKSYAETQPDKQKTEVYQRAMSYAITATNEVRRENRASWENNLNELGYEFAYKNEDEKALEVLKLNTILFPNSENTYESCGEILAKMGRKQEAIKMYQKTLELNPGNKRAEKFLENALKGQ
jgi:tetratricopeptide (TPR) repeat protein